MKYGYARVSTLGQNLESQIEQLEMEKCDKVYCEKYTGTTIKRPVFERLLEVVQKGDTLVVTKLDRFARNTREALDVIQKLFDNEVKVHILNMGIIENTPTGQLTFTMLSAFAQFERDLIIIRTQEGKELAKKNNPDYHEGRNYIYSRNTIQEAYQYWKNGQSVAKISNKTGISVTTLYRRFRALEG